MRPRLASAPATVEGSSTPTISAVAAFGAGPAADNQQHRAGEHFAVGEGAAGGIGHGEAGPVASALCGSGGGPADRRGVLRCAVASADSS